MDNKQDNVRPGFIDTLCTEYGLRKKNIVLLSGGTQDMFCNRVTSQFTTLEQLLNAEFSEKFNVVRMDIATGASFYDEDTEHEVLSLCVSCDAASMNDARIQQYKNKLLDNRHNPLPTLTLLRDMAGTVERLRLGRKDKNKKPKPLCIIMQFAGSLFPEGNFGSLSELDRQRLVFFLSWVSDPLFTNSATLLVLINPTKSEVNGKITSLPNAAHVEIPLPAESERRAFVDWFTKANPIQFDMGATAFCRDTAGLTLDGIEDILEVAAANGNAVKRDDVVKEVNHVLQASLGDIVKFSNPAHTPADIIGGARTHEIFTRIFERCDDPETAVSAILVSGPNGSGKTFRLGAYARQSGRVVLELGGIRGSYFGETDKLFELLRWHVATYGRILFLIDEAHTAFGSVHSADTHETEKRLAGNFIKMMGEPSYLGKVLWGLMTSRPDELDPDVKSRAPIQVPIFDPEGDERKEFIVSLFNKKNIRMSDAELAEVVAVTDHYSARDFRNLVAEVQAARKRDTSIGIPAVLKGWSASKSIMREREFQMLVAAQHCSYPELLPASLRNINPQELAMRIDELKMSLHR